MRFKDKTVIVTGAASGIGRSVALAAAEEGANVMIADINLEMANKTRQNIDDKGGNCSVVQIDLNNQQEIRALCTRTIELFGSIHHICYSAGIQTYGTVVDTEEDLWDATLGVNLKGMYLTAKYCIPEIVKAGGGSIVNISSVQGLVCQKNVAAYAASKGGAIALSRAMALDHASDNIRVNCICPGSIDTPMLKFGAGKHGNAEKVIKEWGQHHPLGRVGTPEEIAKTVLFLWSSDAGFITAQPIVVDGGLISGIF